MRDPGINYSSVRLSPDPTLGRSRVHHATHLRSSDSLRCLLTILWRPRVLTAASWPDGDDLHPPVEREARVSGLAAHRGPRAEVAGRNPAGRRVRASEGLAYGLSCSPCDRLVRSPDVAPLRGSITEEEATETPHPNRSLSYPHSSGLNPAPQVDLGPIGGGPAAQCLQRAGVTCKPGSGRTRGRPARRSSRRRDRLARAAG